MQVRQVKLGNMHRTQYQSRMMLSERRDSQEPTSTFEIYGLDQNQKIRIATNTLISSATEPSLEKQALEQQQALRSQLASAFVEKSHKSREAVQEQKSKFNQNVYSNNQAFRNMRLARQSHSSMDLKNR